MTKLRRDLTVAMAGASSGLFSASVYLLAARVLSFYDYSAFRREYGYEVRYDRPEDLWWIPMVVWQVVLSMAASLLVHRYATSRTSTFLRWQAIGFVTLVGWTLTVLTGFSIDCLIHGSTVAIDQTFSIFKFLPVAQFVAAVFASHVLYGTAVQAASTEEISGR